MGILSRIYSWWYSMFLEHPHDNDFSYFQHLRHSVVISLFLMKGSFTFFVHGLFPRYFESTGKRIIYESYLKNVSIPKCPRASVGNEVLETFPPGPTSSPVPIHSIPNVRLTPLYQAGERLDPPRYCLE